MTNIAGTYELKKYGYLFKKDESFKPISDWYSGLIHYSESGFMNVLVRFAKNPEVFEDIVAYSGSYKVEGNEIRHLVTHSVRPSYEGQELVRTFKLNHNELYIEFENTAEFIKFAIWTK